MTRQRFPKLLRPFVALLLAIATINLMATRGFAQEATTKRSRRQRFRARWTASTSSTCPQLNPAEKLPLVMVLHGCLEQGGGQLPFIDKIQHDSNFDAVADQERFIMVYPNTSRCQSTLPTMSAGNGGVDDRHPRGPGEVADLVSSSRRCSTTTRSTRTAPTSPGFPPVRG